MSHTFLLVSTGQGAGLTTVSLGLLRALDRLGIRTGFCKPIAQQYVGDYGPERSTLLVQKMANIKSPKPMSLRYAESLLGADKEGDLMEEIVALYKQSARDVDVVVVEGLIADAYTAHAAHLNAAIAQALDAEVLLVSKPDHDLQESIDLSRHIYRDGNESTLAGIIINKIGAPSSKQEDFPYETLNDTVDVDITAEIERLSKQLSVKSSPLIGCVPWKAPLLAPRTIDIANFLGAKVIRAGDIETRRVQHIELCARTLANIHSVYQPHMLLIIPGDRDDVFIAACMAAMNGVPLAGLLLTGGFEPSPTVMKLCEQALQTGLPLMQVDTGSYQTAAKVASMPAEVAIDDEALIDRAMEHVASHLDAEWLQARCAIHRERRLSPAAFRYQLAQRAKLANKRVILPEGEEPRTILAAYKCQKRGIAQCVLLGNPEKIIHAAEAQGISIDGIQIIDPQVVRKNYINAMVDIRSHKGLTAEMAEDELQDNVVLATMMLALDEVDGLVSGALHTTANTVRPALQLIGTSPTSQLVSSIFFMCLPEQVLVYGDCAINPDPNADQLADIAIQSADSAARFGLQPRVAMISYSTGDSGSGSGVEKVRQATALVHQRRPDILIDGPLQYDAAAITSVGKSKAPKSKVAGQANVFIFPDLNTGNTTYKAVQRSAHVVSIGPMLQGLNKPVNDLSRGANVEDIIYTIALTSIQAE